ncbi:MAG: molybdopterin converting factor subunit 1 [Pseudomonadota bacterium]|nr:molybdopterin converting factor subunit 1 [Pseudomonadota bacterium]
MLRILYFARLRETFCLSFEEIPSESINTVSDLKFMLAQRGGVWSRELASDRAVRVAVNQEMAHDGDVIREGDEIALFPPVTGG